MDPILDIVHFPSSEAGASPFKEAQGESFVAYDEFLTQAALQNDTSALWRLLFKGHGLSRIHEMKLLPSTPKFVGRGQVVDTHACQRGDNARKLARTTRALWLQLQAPDLNDAGGGDRAAVALPGGGGCGAPCRVLPAAGACDGAPAGRGAAG